MEKVINIKYPKSLANSLKLNEKEFETEIKISSLIKLYELGKVSSGVAARVLALSRIDFLELLAKYKVSSFGVYDADDLQEDIENA
jgi:predicted HTH domain antitoxin